MDQMMADIMGGFSSLGSKGGAKKGRKPEKQKLPFVSSLEMKTSKEIIRELTKAEAGRDERMMLSLLKGLHEHTEIPQAERMQYLETEARLAVKLGHDDVAFVAADALLRIDPFHANGNYYLLNVTAMRIKQTA